MSLYHDYKIRKYARASASAHQRIAATTGNEYGRGWQEGHQRGYSEGWYAAWAEINRQRAQQATP